MLSRTIWRAKRISWNAAYRRPEQLLLRFEATGSFPDAGAFLAECSRRGLEGIVAKGKDAPYRSGTRSSWIKVNTAEWKAANQHRAALFEKG